MTAWFSGGEVATHRRLLAQEGVTTLALNLSAYFAQRQPLVMKDAYDGFDLVLYSSEGGLDPMRVGAFIEANVDRFTYVYGLGGGGDKGVPVWTGGDLSSFYALAAQHAVVGLHEDVATDGALMPAITAYAKREGVKLMCSTSKSEALQAVQWGEVIVGGWLAAGKHHELQVWDGRTVRRYPRARKANAIEKHAGQVERLGIDVEDLRNEVAGVGLRLAVRSWAIACAPGAQVVAIDTKRPVLGVVREDDDEIATEHPSVRKEAVERPRVPLPVMSMPVIDDGLTESQAKVVKLSHKLLRSCDSCSISAMCPQYQPAASCAFEIPVTLTSKGELQALMNSMLEMQAQRVFMARMTEDLLSQGLDPVVSAELERMMRMIESVKRISEQRAEVTITAKAEGGVLSRLFGDRVGEANRQLGAPVPSGELIESIVDAELVDPS